MNTIDNPEVHISADTDRVSVCFLEGIPDVEEDTPTIKDRAKAVFNWIWKVIKHPHFASSIVLMWCFNGLIIAAYSGLPQANYKIVGVLPAIEVALMVAIPGFAALRVFFLLEEAR